MNNNKKYADFDSKLGNLASNLKANTVKRLNNGHQGTKENVCLMGMSVMRL